MMVRWLCLLFLYLNAGPLLAHARNNAFLDLVQIQESVTGTLQLRLEDLPLIVDIDANRNNEITWGEIKQSRERIIDYVQNNLTLGYGDDECSLSLGEFQIQYLVGMNYLYVPVDGVCSSVETQLNIKYSLLFEQDAAHRGLMKLTIAGEPLAFVFSPSQRTFSIEKDEDTARLYVLTFLEEGIWHIWTGFDHQLFLFALLIPLFGTGKNAPAPAEMKLKPVTIKVLKLVTGFTLGHSFTLIATSIYRPTFDPSVVEILIAASVVAAGINILWPIFDKNNWRIAFAFGLLHGLGFASALSGLALPTDYFILCLLSFNLGVELGQLAILPCIPLLLLLSKQSFYQSRALPTLAVLVISCSVWWTIERVMQL